MPRRSSIDRDFTSIARRVVERAVGEHLDGSPLEESTTEDQERKNPHAVALGRLGGKKGGRARAEKLSSSRRRKIASLAAKARWHGK
jgi:hypothetical protein